MYKTQFSHINILISFAIYREKQYLSRITITHNFRSWYLGISLAFLIFYVSLRPFQKCIFLFFFNLSAGLSKKKILVSRSHFNYIFPFPNKKWSEKETSCLHVHNVQLRLLIFIIYKLFILFILTVLYIYEALYELAHTSVHYSYFMLSIFIRWNNEVQHVLR